jgi:hypothetical protein
MTMTDFSILSTSEVARVRVRSFSSFEFELLTKVAIIDLSSIIHHTIVHHPLYFVQVYFVYIANPKVLHLARTGDNEQRLLQDYGKSKYSAALRVADDDLLALREANGFVCSANLLGILEVLREASNSPSLDSEQDCNAFLHRIQC